MLGHHQMVNTEIRLISDWYQIDIRFCSQRWRSSIQLAKTRPGADCGSDHELLIAKFRLKLKKVGKITRPFKYNLNQIPYDYTVEVTNRFKELDLIDKSAWRTMDGGLWQEAGIKTISKKKKSRKFVWGDLTNSCEKKRSERQRRKGKICPFENRVPKNSKERKESLPQWSVKS